MADRIVWELVSESSNGSHRAWEATVQNHIISLRQIGSKLQWCLDQGESWHDCPESSLIKARWELQNLVAEMARWKVIK